MSVIALQDLGSISTRGSDSAIVLGQLGAVIQLCDR